MSRLHFAHCDTGKRERSAERSSEDPNAGRRKLRRTASAKLRSQNVNMWGQISGAENSIRNAKEKTPWQQPEHFDNEKQNRTPLEQTTGNSPPKAKVGSTIEELEARRGRTETACEKGQGQGLFQGRDVYVFGFDAPKVSLSLRRDGDR